MKTKFIVEGMHCESCKMLVKMGLEEAGYGKKIAEVSNTEDGKHGMVILTKVPEIEYEKVSKIINESGHYKVVEISSL